jgi:hypothetical protein
MKRAKKQRLEVRCRKRHSRFELENPGARFQNAEDTARINECNEIE